MTERDWSVVRRIAVPNREYYPCWLYINKCGTTTMANTLRKIPGGVDACFEHDYPVEREVVTMWRNPIDRIESTYRMYQKNKVRSWQHWSFEDFILNACSDKRMKDPHIIPMYEVATNRYGRFVPDRVILWDWIEVARVYGLKPIQVHNHTPGDRQHWTREMRVAYEERYWLDFHIWNKVPD